MGCSASTPTPSALAEERVSSPHGKQQRPSFGKDEPRGNSPQLSQQSRFEAPFAPAAVTSRCDAPQWASLSPAMLVLDHFLSSDECDGLVALASGDLRRSRVTDGHVSSGRTSFSCFLTGEKASHALVTSVEKRIADVVDAAHKALLALDDAAASAQQVSFVAAEPLQVVRYTVGQGYCAHFDNRSGSMARKVTFMVYLCDVEEGGFTFFPRARPMTAGGSAEEHGSTASPDRAKAGAPGMRIQPRKGRALIFWNVRNGREDDASLHEAQPVLAGQKLIATKWLTLLSDNDAGN